MLESRLAWALASGGGHRGKGENKQYACGGQSTATVGTVAEIPCESRVFRRKSQQDSLWKELAE